MNKEVVRELLEAESDPLDVDAFLERIVLQQKIEAGEADIAAGRTVEHGDAKKRLGRWLE